MTGLEFVKDYKHIPELRAAFNSRLREIFSFDMERLYTEEYWSDVYVPYSFVLDGKIAANVSAISQEFIVDGEMKKGLLIESVLTAPEFRGRGLASKLMRMVMDEHDTMDFMCLYALPTALEFYPRFGFKWVPEHRCVIKNADIPDAGLSKRRLEPSNPEDYNTLKYFLSNSAPVSRKFSVTGDKSFFMYELTRNTGNTLWYLEGLNAVAAVSEKDGNFHINHILAASPPSAEAIIKYFPGGSPRDIIFGYTPDMVGSCQADYKLMTGPTLFMKGSVRPSGQFMLPYYFRS